MKSLNNTGRAALLCVASLCVASPSNVAAQRYGNVQGMGFQSLGEHVLASHGWLIATYGNGPVNVLAVNLDDQTRTPVAGVSLPSLASGFASLENGENTTALLIGVGTGYAINMALDQVMLVNKLSPALNLTVFGTADLGSDDYNVGGFVGDNFFWLDGELTGPLGDPLSIPDPAASAGIAGGEDSVIVATMNGPVQVTPDGMVSDPLVQGAVTALVGNSQRGRALIYEDTEGTRVLARIMNDDSVVTIMSEGTPTSRDELATAEGMVMWVDRSNPSLPVIRVATPDGDSVTIEMPVEGLVVDEPALWATRIATDGDYLVAASPGQSHLDLFDLRCYSGSGRSCPMGSACTMGSNHCVETDPGDAGPGFDAGSFDAGLGDPDAGSSDAGGDAATSEMDTSPPEDREPRAELSCTCRAAGASSSGPLPFAFAGLLCLTIARRRRS